MTCTHYLLKIWQWLNFLPSHFTLHYYYFTVLPNQTKIFENFESPDVSCRKMLFHADVYPEEG